MGKEGTPTCHLQSVRYPYAGHRQAVIYPRSSGRRLRCDPGRCPPARPKPEQRLRPEPLRGAAGSVCVRKDSPPLGFCPAGGLGVSLVLRKQLFLFTGDTLEEFGPPQLVQGCLVLEQALDPIHLLEEVLHALSLCPSLINLCFPHP
jgi:hypothetical protein